MNNELSELKSVLEEKNSIFDTKLQLEKIENLASDKEGKNSTVFIGRDLQLDAKFLVKKINKENLMKNTDDLFSESKVLQLTRHRNIMPIQYATQDEENIYMVLPYMEKGSMQQFFYKYESNRQLIGYCLDFLSGLTHAHVLDILHSDIKPSNIIIDNSDRAILTDFGQCVKLDAEGKANPKPMYLFSFSPSRIENQIIEVSDDIHQVGLTLYRLFNSVYYDKSVLSINNRNELMNQILKREFPIDCYMPHIPSKLVKIIRKCLGKATSSYDTVLDVMNEICQVDQMLDIGFEYVQSNNTYTWHEHTNTAIIKVELDLNTFNLNGTKEMKSNGKVTKISKLTKKCKSVEEAFGIVGDYWKG